MTDSTHPAGSPEFLSRLHDGDLSVAEHDAFESHRAACPECREAVAEFERSLSAFRAAPTAPVPTDLSARILRKIRAQSPSRRPFGVMFGIDIRWAGVLMAALLVAIIAPELFSPRKPKQASPAPEPLSAYVVDAEPDKQAAAREAPRARAQEAPKAPEAKRDERAKESPQSGFVAGAPPAAPPAASAPGETAADEIAQKPQPSREAQNAAAPPLAAAKRSAALAERAGGEVGAYAKEESHAAAVRLDVRSLDGDGPPPEIAQDLAIDRFVALRGREFVLMVEADGSVRSVEPAGREDKTSRIRKDTAGDPGSSYEAVRELRFRSTGRPRRLLVRVQ